MPDAVAVKRALARLARDPRGDEPVRARAVIEEAGRAVDDVATAGAFARTVGVDRLERAIAVAKRRGDESLARRGERALAAFEWFREAARRE